MTAGELYALLSIASVVCFAYKWGRIDGECAERRRTAKTVAAMEKIRGMANWIMTAEKFTGPGARSYSDATYQLDDEMFAIRMSRIQFEREN